MASYLGQHPDVFVSEYKEPNYFAFAEQVVPCVGPAPESVIRDLVHRHTVNCFDDYRRLFEGAGKESAVGEASVRYLYFPEAAERIAETLGEPRCIVILREPVARMYSHYCMNRQFLLEPLDFAAALKAEQQRIDNGWGWDWHYRHVSNYAPQVTRYFERLGRDNVKVVLYDDYCRDAVGVYRDICRYLEIDDNFQPNMNQRGKVTYEPISGGIERWLYWPNSSLRRVESLVPRKVRRPIVNLLGRFNRRPTQKTAVRRQKLAER